MITSNNINARNLAQSKLIRAESTLTGNETINIDTKHIEYVEINITGTRFRTSSKLEVVKTGGLVTDMDRPILMHQDIGVIDNNTITLGYITRTTLYIDPKGAESITLNLIRDMSDGITPLFRIDATFYGTGKNDVFKIEPKSQIITVKSGVASRDWFGFNVQGFRYAIIDTSVFSNETSVGHFSVTVTDSTGATIYPQVKLLNGEIASYGNAQVILNYLGDRKYYIDLMSIDAKLLRLAYGGSSTVNAYIRLLDLTNENPLINTFTDSEDVLFEGEKFKFVRKAKMQDAFNGWFVSTDNYTHKVFLSDDENNPDKHVLDVSSITSAEGSNLRDACIVPYDPEMKNTSVAFRVMIVLQNFNAYVNYYDGVSMTSWGKCKAWESINTARKIPVKTTAEVTANHRFDPTLPDAQYLKNATIVNPSGITMIEYQGDFKAGILGGLCRTKKMVSFGTYLPYDGERPVVWCTTDGGLNWVSQYDFVFFYSNLSANINTSSFADYSGGLSVKKITLNAPTEENKEPSVWFEYTDLPSISSITKGTSTVVNINAHGLANNDLILFSGTGQDDNWNALKCDGFNETSIKPNIYIVTVNNANSFTIKEYKGSYDTTLRCRHIHSINEHVGGITVATGEEYPNSWFLYGRQDYKDASTVVNAFSRGLSLFFRLNSVNEGLQRACGFIMDNAPDPNILFNSDTSYGSLGKYSVPGRTESQMPNRPSNGLWRGKLSQIDNWRDFECILPIGEPAIWMHQLGKIIIAYYQLGSNAVSVDGGATWEVFPNGSNKINGLFNNRLVIGDGYVFEWK